MFHDAQFLLNHYIETYKNKDADKLRVQAASYYQAANYSRLKEWTKSAALLDQFLKDYPDPKTNVYYPYALFDRATCHSGKGENHVALTKVSRILSNFPKVSFIEQTLALKGNILESLQKPNEAEQCYMKALHQAEKKGNDLVARECLFYLVALLGKGPIEGATNPRLAEAIPYYNHFWEHYGNDSPFNAKVVVAGIPAMRKAGKIDEAFIRLQSVIRTIAQHPGSPGLEEAIGSCTAEYLGEHTVEELAEHYFNGTGYSPRLIRAAFRYAIIYAYEQALEEGDPSVDVRRAKAMIRVLFKEFRSDFALHLTTSIHLENGEYDQAITSATKHLNNPNFRQHRTDSRMFLASAHDKAGHIDDAIVAYQQIFISSTSTPASKNVASAILRWMELLWERNEKDNDKSDRQIAYEGGQKFLRMTAKMVEKAGPEEKAIWAKLSQLVSTYEASPDTTKMGVE